MPLESPFVYQLFPDGRGRWVANQAISYVRSKSQEIAPEVKGEELERPLFEGISFSGNFLHLIAST